MANRINYKITLEKHPPVFGSVERRDGALHIAEELPEDTIVRAEASLNVPMSAQGRIFMNGYQSWTYCPEYDRNGRTRGI